MRHTTARIGKRVRVRLTDGSSFIDKLKDIRSRHFEFESHGKINRDRVTSMAINKGPVAQW